MSQSGIKMWMAGRFALSSVKDKDVVFNLGGSIGSTETREIITKKVLPELGLGDYTIRTFQYMRSGMRRNVQRRRILGDSF